MRILSQDDLRQIPKLPQTQAALGDQLYDLIFVAERLGLYDAADLLKRQMGLK